MRATEKFAALALVAVIAGCSSLSKESPTLAQADLPAPPGRMAPPAPPPPPPPPPPPREADQSANIVVTGSRREQSNRQQTSPLAVMIDERMAPAAPNPSAPLPASRYAYIPGVQVPVDPGREQYSGEEVSPVHVAASEPVSTFSVDVDTAAYANARRFLLSGQRPPQDAVRTEEMINYFRYDYPTPDTREDPFSVTTDMSITPWNPETRLLRIGLRGYDLPRTARPPANLVFLIDVSGSMSSADKLPLVQTALRQLAGEMQRQDRVSIVVYAGAAGVVLEPTNDAAAIRSAIDRLTAGGSTAGGAGIELAYNVARQSFIEGGINRVVLATDGDFNVGISNRDALIELIERQRDSGITLTALGFGTGNLNDAMMEQIADHGNGNYSYIDSALEAQKVLSDEMESTMFTIAHDVKIQVEFNPGLVSQYRLIGYENRALREQDFNNDAVDAGEIGAGHQVTAIYEIVPNGAQGWIGERRYQPLIEAEGAAADEMAFVQLRYKLPGEDRSRLIRRPIAASALASARNPRGDMAFAASVAAYGQLLRGDELMGRFGFDDAVALAGNQDGFWREEFLRLAGIAESLDEG